MSSCNLVTFAQAKRREVGTKSTAKSWHGGMPPEICLKMSGNIHAKLV